MSISKRIMEAIDKMVAGDAEGALIPVSIAIDATAQKEYPKCETGDAYKIFLHKNLKLITKSSFGGVTIENIRIKYNHPKIKVDNDGTCSVEQILYHAVRCGLLHKANLPLNLKFTNEGMIKVENDLLILPASLVYGLITAVVSSPVNCKESIPLNYGMNIRNHSVPLNELWGKGEKVSEILSKLLSESAS